MVRGQALSHALGRQNAVAALLALADAKLSLGANDLTDRIEGFSGAGIKVARHLEGFGLVRIKVKPGVAGRSAYEIALTPIGQKVAQGLGEIAAFVK